MTTVRTPPPTGPRTSPVTPHARTRDRRDVSADASKVFDELAALFLTDDEQAAGDTATVASQPNGAAKRFTEVLLAGHMPVRGNLWVTPYADAIARQCGTAALIRVDAPDQVGVQVLRGRGIDSHSTGATVRETIDSLAWQVNAWIIGPMSPTNADELVASGADRVTILTSADSVAVVAAYKLIKQLAAAAMDLDTQLPPIALAVVGSDLHEAQQMVERINQTACSFLETDVQLRLCLPQIDSSVRCTQHMTIAGESAPSANTVVSWINSAWSRPASTPQLRLTAVDSEDETGGADAAEPHRIAPPSPRESQHASVGSARATIKLSPKPSKRAEPPQQAQAIDPQQDDQPQLLATYVDSLAPLQPRCPGHEMVELAVDAHGVMHLLAWEQNLRDLRVVKSWVQSHSDVLKLACHEHHIEPERAAVCHVFTAKPASLSDLHGSDLRLHVLAPVSVAGKTAWYAAPLN